MVPMIIIFQLQEKQHKSTAELLVVVASYWFYLAFRFFTMNDFYVHESFDTLLDEFCSHLNPGFEPVVTEEEWISHHQYVAEVIKVWSAVKKNVAKSTRG